MVTYCNILNTCFHEYMSTCFHQINVALKSKLKKITKLHETKLINLHRQQNKTTFEVNTTYIKKIVHNFLSYQLWNDELTALLHGLDHHIPSKFNSNKIYTESEQFWTINSTGYIWCARWRAVSFEDKIKKHMW